MRIGVLAASDGLDLQGLLRTLFDDPDFVRAGQAVAAKTG